jgi:hypothetical protein
MIEGEKKGISFGWLIIFIIIILVLFRVDIKEKINSPILNKNIEYIENFFTDLWNNKIKQKFDEGINDISKNLVNTGIETVQDEMNEKLDEMKKE